MPRRASVDEVIRSGRRMARKFLFDRFPVGGNDLGDGEPVFSVVDGGLQKLREASAAKARAQLLPAIERSRYGDCIDSGAGHALVAILAHPFRGGEGAGAPGPVQPIELLRLCMVDEREEIAANPAHHRLDDVQHCGGGDGGVNRIAAVLQNSEPRGRGERLAGSHHPVGGEHRRASERCAFGRAVARERSRGEETQCESDAKGLNRHCGSLSEEGYRRITLLRSRWLSAR